MNQNKPSNPEIFNNLISKSKTLIALFKENETQFIVKKQIAQYSNLDEIEKTNAIISITDENNKLQLVLIFALLIEDIQKDKFLSYFLKVMKGECEKPYQIIFFNSGLMTSSKLTEFRDFYKTLPSRFLSNLQKFIVVHANFLVKTAQIFHKDWCLNWVKSKSEYKDSLIKLCQNNWFILQTINYFPQYVKKSDSSFRDVEKIQERMSKISAVEETKEKKTILGNDLLYYQLNKAGIPTILDVLIHYFISNQQHMLTEGIFRIQSSQIEEKNLDVAFANHHFSKLKLIEDPSTVAGLLKQFFFKLKKPIISYENYDKLKQKIKLHDSLENQCQCIFEDLPSLNKLILKVLLGFLLKVATFEAHNKMSLYNLSVCFTPALLKPKTYIEEDLLIAVHLVKVIEYILKEYNKIFGDEDFQNYLNHYQKKTSMIPIVPIDLANMEDLEDLELVSPDFQRQTSKELTEDEPRDSDIYDNNQELNYFIQMHASLMFREDLE